VFVAAFFIASALENGNVDAFARAAPLAASSAPAASEARKLTIRFPPNIARGSLVSLRRLELIQINA
jgi:hypothetical protein